MSDAQAAKPVSSRSFRLGDRVRTPHGAEGVVVGQTAHGSIKVRFEITDMTFPWSPTDLVLIEPPRR